MRRVDPPGNLYQKVGQLASKSGPAATGRDKTFLEPLKWDAPATAAPLPAG